MENNKEKNIEIITIESNSLERLDQGEENERETLEGGVSNENDRLLDDTDLNELLAIIEEADSSGDVANNNLNNGVEVVNEWVRRPPPPPSRVIPHSVDTESVDILRRIRDENIARERESRIYNEIIDMSDEEGNNLLGERVVGRRVGQGLGENEERKGRLRGRELSVSSDTDVEVDLRLLNERVYIAPGLEFLAIYISDPTCSTQATEKDFSQRSSQLIEARAGEEERHIFSPGDPFIENNANDQPIQSNQEENIVSNISDNNQSSHEQRDEERPKWNISM